MASGRPAKAIDKYGLYESDWILLFCKWPMKWNGVEKSERIGPMKWNGVEKGEWIGPMKWNGVKGWTNRVPILMSLDRYFGYFYDKFLFYRSNNKWGISSIYQHPNFINIRICNINFIRTYNIYSLIFFLNKLQY